MTDHFRLFDRIHLAVTLLHTNDGMADKFIKDTTSACAEIMQNPKKPIEGQVEFNEIKQ